MGNQSEDPRALEKELLSDVFLALTEKPLTVHGRRAAIRAVFAAVEGYLWSLKQDIASAAEYRLGAAEMALLREERYVVGRGGEAETKRLLLNLKDSIRFTVAMTRKLHAESNVGLGDAGWQSLIDSLDVRHRITHPKSAAALDVSDEELNTALDGLLWFLGLTTKGKEAVEHFLSTPEARQRLLIEALRQP